jgi:deoxyhypusine synthase
LFLKRSGHWRLATKETPRAAPRTRFPRADPATVSVRQTDSLLPAQGSSEIRTLVDEGFQAFNAGRLSEACQIFAGKMLAAENDTTIGLTMAGAMTPAGLGGCVIEMMDRGLVDFVISTGATSITTFTTR